MVFNDKLIDSGRIVNIPKRLIISQMIEHVP